MSFGLKPCPFCGGYAVMAQLGAISYGVVCTGCGATSAPQTLPGYSTKANVVLRLKARAARKWNARQGAAPEKSPPRGRAENRTVTGEVATRAGGQPSPALPAITRFFQSLEAVVLNQKAITP
jgi:hypothetical protein